MRDSTAPAEVDRKGSMATGTDDRALTINVHVAISLFVDVERSDLDDLEHVNNSVYLRWVEAAARKHWASIASPDLFSAIAWIAVRHGIDYHRPSFEGERLTVQTRPTKVTRRRAWYETTIMREPSCWSAWYRAGARSIG